MDRQPRVGWLWALLLAAGCAGPARRAAPAAPVTQTVTAVGWAPYDAADPEGSRRRALADAQVRAAEKVNGTSVAGATLVAEAVGVRSRILSEAGGGVAHFDVLEEGRSGGFLKVRIRAAVLVRPAGAPAQAPPLGVKASVTVDAGGAQDPAWRAAAARALRTQLLASGFTVLEPSEGPERGDVDLRARAGAHPIEDPRLGEFKSFEAVLELRAVRPQTGEVLWEGSREASALDLDAQAAAQKAVGAAGRLAGRDAALALSRILWQRY